MPDTIIQPKDVFIQGLPLLDSYDVVLFLFPARTPKKFGMVKYLSNKRVLEIIDKPERTDLRYMRGCVIWKPNFTEWLHEQIEHKNVNDFAHIMNSAIQVGIPFGGALIDRGNFIGLGTYDEIMELDKQLRDDEG
jgi:glucose-1-phosphate thymidylyltransferase